jgi:hypothetical protein
MRQSYRKERAKKSKKFAGLRPFVVWRRSKVGGQKTNRAKRLPLVPRQGGSWIRFNRGNPAKVSKSRNEEKGRESEKIIGWKSQGEKRKRDLSKIESASFLHVFSRSLS